MDGRTSTVRVRGAGVWEDEYERVEGFECGRCEGEDAQLRSYEASLDWSMLLRSLCLHAPTLLSSLSMQESRHVWVSTSKKVANQPLALPSDSVQ